MGLRMLHYAWRTVSRHRLRSMLTVAGVATALFLFVFIEGMQKGVREATESEATKNVLVVYQQSRFCPATSLIPERYAAQIAKIPGVKSVLPVKIAVTNCRASLDTATFRGVPPEAVVSGQQPVTLTAGSVDEFAKRRDAAIMGERLAKRRGLNVGDRFQIAGVPVGVAGIFTSDVPGEADAAYAHLEYLQYAYGKNALGHVTQFEVQVDDAARSQEIAARIDGMFRADAVPTSTKTHKAFITSSTGDLMGIISFTRYLGFLCVVLVLALTANTIYAMVQERVREHAVLQTLGFGAPHLFTVVVAESLMLSVAGGVAGTALAALVLHFGNFALSAEGVSIAFRFSPAVAVAGLAAAAATGFLAAFLPALQAAFAPITESLRRA
jgi:putative ABC transport system permease protein